jgi:hypothetical protein
MALPEPTVLGLADFASGYICGATDLNPAVGAVQRVELGDFETWLRNEWYGLYKHQAPWYGLIRVFEGECERGLRRFLELWDEFKASKPEEEPAGKPVKGWEPQPG